MAVIMWSVESFGTAAPPLADTALTGLAYFLVMWVVELLAKYLFYLCPTGPILGNARHRGILARGVNNISCFLVMGFFGLQALGSLGGWPSHSAKVMATDAGKGGVVWTEVFAGEGLGFLLGGDQASTVYGSAARLYFYSGQSQRLVLLTLAFQTKNFIDTVLHDDGIVFMLHHVATGALAVFALQPYLHLYAPFFFGISEISTLFIAVLVLFDEHHGIKELGERFPLLMSATGVIFAVLFVLLRVLVWPAVGLHFWRDGLAQLYSADTTAGVAPMHSPPVVYLFLLVNIGLTTLQLVWLKEIIDQAFVLASGGKIAGASSTSGSNLQKPKEH